MAKEKKSNVVEKMVKVIEGVFDVPVKDLKFFENNPKKFTSKQFGRLLRNVKEVGILQALTVNKRTMTVLDGNQRLKVSMQLGIPSVKVSYVDVAPENEGKLIAFFNKLRAEYDEDNFHTLLKQYENDDFFKDLLADYDEKVKSVMAGVTPEYNIVREVDESYNYVVFITKKSVDHLNIESFFNLSRVYDPHKSKLIGMGRVVDGEALNRLIGLAISQGYKNINEL